MADFTDQQFGNYRLLHSLGVGGAGEVYLGEHVRLGEKAALKILYMRLAAEDHNLFLQEARTVADLRHPHIVRVLDFDIQRGQPFLVLDYIPQGSLAQRYPRDSQVRLPLAQVANYVTQVASALQYAHDRHIIHRDIKPANILIGEQDQLLVSDFSLATIAHGSASTQEQTSLGTLAYMAPEQLQGLPGPASDQYSLAVTAYLWLTGGLPFQGSLTEIIAQHLSAPVPLLRPQVPELSDEAERVLMTALAKNPAERFDSVQAFAAAFAQACQLEQKQAPASQPDIIATPAPGQAPNASQNNPVPQATMQNNPMSVPLAPLTAVPQGPAQTTGRGLVTPLSALGSTLICAILLLVGHALMGYVTTEIYFVFNVFYCLVLGWSVARRAAKFRIFLLLCLLGNLFLFAANFYAIKANGYWYTNNADYLYRTPFIMICIAIIAGSLSYLAILKYVDSLQLQRVGVTDKVSKLATQQQMGRFINSFGTSKRLKIETSGISVSLFIGLGLLLVVFLSRFLINYLFILLVLACIYIFRDMLSKRPTEKIYLYADGLIIPTTGGLLAVHWHEISHLAFPNILISRTGTQITLPEVTEDFQQLHTTIQQHVMRPQVPSQP
ncbi:hypothetical protein KDW_45590 [Dictyobacter vulcani]|uniref:non-specific serine/threonine protein kinase n=1 Tax=Dictyobacter vulcani TaxID=2607529 RepID=A0A5J4KV59_9CHLR|nr:serine/threonine-protein kinase [Dictyobacter vulcani]GER90397.1 hypothetical protein KDW_45590 [Dictyobacter vulcani]